MNPSPLRATHLALTLTAILTVLAFTTTAASAAVFKLETFKTSIDVKLNLTEHSNWNGMQPGCTAPEEKFDMTYQMRVDSTPSRKSDISNGTTTLSNLAYGTTPSYGDKSSFHQYSSSAPWEIETQYPASCNAQAPPVPEWATSPTCKKVYNRVESHLLMSTRRREQGRWLDRAQPGQPCPREHRQQHWSRLAIARCTTSPPIISKQRSGSIRLTASSSCRSRISNPSSRRSLADRGSRGRRSRSSSTSAVRATTSALRLRSARIRISWSDSPALRTSPSVHTAAICRGRPARSRATARRSCGARARL